ETGERLRVDGCIPDEQHEPGPFRDSEQRRHAHDRLVIRLSRLARPAAAEHAEAVLDRVLLTAVRAAEPSAQYTPLLDPVGKEDEAKLRTAARTGQNIGQKEVHVAVACAGQGLLCSPIELDLPDPLPQVRSPAPAALWAQPFRTPCANSSPSTIRSSTSSCDADYRKKGMWSTPHTTVSTAACSRSSSPTTRSSSTSCCPTRWVTTSPARSADRKSTRLNSSHVKNSYAVFCLKKK